MICLATSLETIRKGEQKIAMVGQGNMSELSIVGLTIAKCLLSLQVIQYLIM